MDGWTRVVWRQKMWWRKKKWGGLRDGWVDKSSVETDVVAPSCDKTSVTKRWSHR